MNKVKALVLVAICVIALGRGVIIVSNAEAAIISEWNDAGGNQAVGTNSEVVEELILEPNTSVEMYDLINVDGQTGFDSYNEITTGYASVSHNGQTFLDDNNIIKDDILDSTDADYTKPMQNHGIVVVAGLSGKKIELIGPYATLESATCIDSGGASHIVNVPSSAGWYQEINMSTCAPTSEYGLSTTKTDVTTGEYGVVYNDTAIWQNGTTPYVLDMRIDIIGTYLNGGAVDAYEPEESLTINNIDGTDYLTNIYFPLWHPGLNPRNIQNAIEISFTISDSEEYGYTDAGKTPEELNGGVGVPVNLIFNDMERTAGWGIKKDDLYGAIIPYCEVKYNTDLTIDTANTNSECLTTETTGVSIGDSDNQENDFGYINGDSRYEDLRNKRGYTEVSGVWQATEPDALLPGYIIDQRTKVYDTGEYIGFIDSWFKDGDGYEQTATNYQISTTSSNFKLYHTVQSQWYFDKDYSYDANYGHAVTIQSTKEPIVSMAKVQEDAGIDGKGVNDDIVSPGETVHYRLYAINSGFDGETGYRFYDDVTNLLEYTGVVSNVGVKKITAAEFKKFLPAYTLYMNDPTSGDIPACGSTEATYTCEDVTTITNSSSGALVDITLNEALLTQTAYELSFDVVVAADYNGQTDKTITNTGYLTEPGCTITSGVPSSLCSANESVTIEYGSIALKIAKDVNDTVDSTYTPSDGIAANADSYASSEEWLNYKLTITNASTDGALNVAQDVQIVDDLTLDPNLSKIDPATIVVTSSIDGVLATTDYTDASIATKLDITLPAIEVDETMTITFKAQVL